MSQWNTQVFSFFYQFQDIPYIGIIADLPIFFLPIFLLSVWLYHTFQKQDDDLRLKLLHIFYACVLGMIFSYIIKSFIEVDRPDSYIAQTGNLIMSDIPESSFPSDHATISFAFVTALFFTGFKKVWRYFLPFVIMMNISRIIVWVHWPLDILVGTMLWIIVAIMFFKHIEKLKLVKTLDVIIIQVMKTFRLY